MGWKSTMQIKREEAISLIFSKLSTVHTMTDEELCDTLEALGYGEDSKLPYYGHNFSISYIDNPDYKDCFEDEDID